MPEIELISDLNIDDADGITPEGIHLIFKTQYTALDDSGGCWPVLQVVWNSGIAPSMVAAFLYDTIRKVSVLRSSRIPEHIQIDRVWIEFEEGQILKRIEESISIENGNSSQKSHSSADDKNAKAKQAVGTATGAAVGAGAGMAGAVAALSAAGTAGLSGAGITTGLTAIGGTMLGGMAVLTGGVLILAGAGAFLGYKLLSKR